MSKISGTFNNFMLLLMNVTRLNELVNDKLKKIVPESDKNKIK